LKKEADWLFKGVALKNPTKGSAFGNRKGSDLDPQAFKKA
jgi:hypothetical protein